MAAQATDLTDLVERLRTAGFRVDTRQYLTAHELLLAYAARGRALDDDPGALASHLGPIFCTLPEEQRRFASEVATWRGGSVPPPEPAQAVPAARPFVFWRRSRWAITTAACAIALAAATAIFLYPEYADVTLDGTVVADAGGGRTEPASQAKVSFRDQPLAVDAVGRFRLTTKRAAGDGSLQAELAGYAPAIVNVDYQTDTPIRLTLRRAREAPVTSASPVVPGAREIITLGAPPRYQRDGGVPWATVAAGSIIAALLTLALLLWAGRTKRQLALKRLEALGDVEELTLAPAATPAVTLADHELRRLASALRRPQEQAVIELNTVASVDATLRAGGLFAPVYSARRAMPEYLVLMQRRSTDDHWAAWVDEWVDRLMANGVNVECFTFGDDPRTCYGDEERKRPYRLIDLVTHHHRATLFLFAESDVCFDPLRRALEPWVEMLHALPRRVLFTPEAPFRWTRREWTLSAEGFVVLPASEVGLRMFAGLAGDWRIERLFPAPYARAYPGVLANEPQRWLDRNAPPEPLVDTLLRQLRGYLGPEGFAWLCACAVYPQISWPLTLQLGVTLGGAPDPGAGDAAALQALPTLARLPWLRHGFMPDWLRRTLVSQLSTEQELAVRRSIESMLEQLALAATPEAGTAATAGGSGAVPSGSSLTISRWIGPLDLLHAAPAASPLQDRVFLGFMAGVSTDALSVQVGAAFRNLFRRRIGMLPGATTSAPMKSSVEALREQEAPKQVTDAPARLRAYISYRRDDSAPYAGRLADNLRSQARDVDVWWDRELTAGSAWQDEIGRNLRSADAILVIIGQRWLDRDGVDGKSGLFDANDFIRTEIAFALAQNLTVIPVLVGGARMPREEDMPPDVAPLARRNAIQLTDERWQSDVERLVKDLERLRPAATAAQAGTPTATKMPIRIAVVRKAEEGREFARALAARARAWWAFHPTLGSGLGSLTVGLVAFVALWGLLPASPVLVPPATSFAAFSPDGRWLATRAANGNAALIDFEARSARSSALSAVTSSTGRAIAVLPAVGTNATAAAFSADGATLAVGYDDGSVRRIDVAAREATVVPAMRLPTAILSVAYAPDGRLLVANGERMATSYPDSQRVDMRELLPSRPADVQGIALAHDGERYAVLLRDGTVHVVPTEGGASTSLRCGATAVPAISPDDRQLACGGLVPGAVRMPGSGKGDLQALPHPGPFDIVSVAFSRDGRILAGGGSDGLVDLWDARDGSNLLDEPLGGPGGRVLAIAFNPSGDRLVAVAPNQFVAWPLLRQQPSQSAPADEVGKDATAPDSSQRGVAMPSLIGMNVEIARIALSRQNFRLEPPEQRASPRPRGTVIAQTPPARSSVAPGSSVRVVVSDGTGAASKLDGPAGDAANAPREPSPTQTTGNVRDPAQKALPAPSNLRVDTQSNPAPATQTDGWCCIRRDISLQQRNVAPTLSIPDRPFKSTGDECRRVGGVFTVDEQAAIAMCAASRPPASAR